MAASLIPGRAARMIVILMSAIGYGLLLTPILTIVALSFFSPEFSGEPLAPTLLWYERVFSDASLFQTVEQSLLIAASTSIIATFLGTTGAIALEHGRFPGKALLEALTLLPLILPELVLGISSLVWFATLRFTLGSYSIILAHTTFAVSYALVTVRSSLRHLDPALIDAARDLGCSTMRAYGRVVLPLIMPGIVGGALMAFILSFDDFLISFFTAGAGADTLPMLLYSMVRFGINREMYALSSLLIAMTAIVVFFFRFLLSKPITEKAL